MSSASQESQEHGQACGSRKVKITILASEWGSNKGELSTVSRELAIHLAKSSSAEITFFVPKCNDDEKKAALSHNVHILEAKRRPGFGEREWLSFPPEHLQVDIIVGHGVKLGKHAQIIRVSHKCKWVQVVHSDPEEEGMFKSYPNPISTGEEKRSVEVELCKLADFVVGVGPKVTEAFRSYLRGYRRDESIFEFTPGLFDEFTSVEQVPEERKQRSVLVFGRGDAEDFELQGFDIAGRAVSSLPDTQLVFVGAPDGNHEEVAKRFLDCRVPANRLKVRSYDKARESLKRLFCEVDLVLLASRTQGFGLTGLEALSAGLPVLASKNSGFGEALKKVLFGSSFVIDSEDPEIWAAAIKKIWEKDRKTRLREAKSLRFSYDEKYSWTKQSDALLFKMIQLVRAFLRLKVDCKATKMGEKRGKRKAKTATVPPNTSNQPKEVRSPSNAGIGGSPSTQAVVNGIAQKCFQHVDASKPEQLDDFLQYMEKVRKVIIIDVQEGSLMITVEIRSVKILKELWEDYRSGHLNEVAQKFLVTEDVLKEFGLTEVRLATTIAYEEYKACRYFLTRPDLIRVRLDYETITGPGIQGGVTGTVVTSPRPEKVVKGSTASNTLNQEQGVDMTALTGQKGGSGYMLSGTQVLQSIERKYFQTVDPANQEERNAFLKYLTGVGKVLFTVAEEGGLIFTLECRSLLLVDQLWEDYFTGRLNEIAQKFLVTEDILKPLGLVNVKLVTQIVEEEYRECRQYFWNRSRVQYYGGFEEDEHYAAGRGCGDDDQEVEAIVRSTDPFALVTPNGHKISWKAGYIQTEKAKILVSSQGACSQAIITAGGQAMAMRLLFEKPKAGDITVTPGSGNLACNHVIHTICCNWNERGGNGETVLRNIVQKCLQKCEELGGTSIAFPVIGAGNLQFPPKEASRIMLDEVIGFCQTNPSSTVKDIRFVVYQQDHALITAFGQEMATLQSQHKLCPRHTMSGFSRNIPSKFGLSKPGQGRQNRETTTLSRKVKGAEEGIALPQHWVPMPPSETVRKVQLAPWSSEYQDVLRKMQATTGRMSVQTIERIQNPLLYQSYMVRKQKMDKDNGGQNERQLFHGTDGKNIKHINTQGFNRSFCGAHGTVYGRGVYFARDPSYSVQYTGDGSEARHMYLARVLVGQYCAGDPSMIVPPPKHPSRPEILYESVVDNTDDPAIFVVFHDTQCYPEYLITFDTSSLCTLI